MENWKIEFTDKKFDLKGSILITGLPGIGNVGKIVADFLIEELKFEKVCSFFSYYMPHSVFVKEDSLVEMPKISLYFKEINNKKILILAGDAQPIDEMGCFTFCEVMLDFFIQHGCSEIITLGGIGLNSIPKTPKVYCTGNNKEIVEKYALETNMNMKVYGVVGPIVGVSGLLLGLSERRNIKAVSFLAETLGHPMYLGLKGAREILKIFNQKLGINVDMKNLEKDINEIESKMKLTDDFGKGGKRKKGTEDDVNYIG